MRNYFFFLVFVTLSVFPFPLRAQESFDATIPVLDMNEYHDETKRADFIEKMKQALCEVGFFAVINTALDKKALDFGYDAAAQFFQMDFAQKQKLYDPTLNAQRGYVAKESAKGEQHADFKEYLHIGRALLPDEHIRTGILPNIWSKEMELEKPMLDVLATLSEYVETLSEAFSLCLGAPKELLQNRTKDGDTMLRVIHYPAGCPEGQVWAAAHTDIDLYTILPRATEKGLQLQNKEGKWIDVLVPDDAVVVNCGDMLESMSNGEFRSSVHRVVASDTTKERYSMVLFIHPEQNASVGPLPYNIQKTGGVRRYAEATRQELLEERLADLGIISDAALQHLGSCGVMDRLIDVNRASIEAMQALDKAGYASPKVKEALDQSTVKRLGINNLHELLAEIVGMQHVALTICCKCTTIREYGGSNVVTKIQNTQGRNTITN